MTLLECPFRLVDSTLEALREGGQIGVERVVFWLGHRAPAGSLISEIYAPMQEAEEDYFRIPPQGMIDLMNHLRHHRLVLLAQVHSHPGKAFHSKADDRWAVVRHEGALSIVVPKFAFETTALNFEKDTAVFRLAGDDRWVHVSANDLSTFLRLT
jgi:proteasome lid subunit RPN8/RPN11